MKIIRKMIRNIITITILLLIIKASMKYGSEYIDKFIYPIKYKESVMKYSEEYRLDPMFVLSIIKTESKFDQDARSSKDARGLMQVTPKTGEWAAEKLGMENYDHEQLYDPEINIKIGCWYLDNLRTQFDYNMKLVAAAYNGGSGNVTKWLGDSEYSDDGKNLKKIPFEETENYVKKVFDSYEKYKAIYINDEEVDRN